MIDNILNLAITEINIKQLLSYENQIPEFKS